MEETVQQGETTSVITSEPLSVPLSVPSTRQERRAAERAAIKASKRAASQQTSAPVSDISRGISLAKSQIPGGSKISTKAIKKMLSGPKAQEVLNRPEFSELRNIVSEQPELRKMLGM